MTIMRAEIEESTTVAARLIARRDELEAVGARLAARDPAVLKMLDAEKVVAFEPNPEALRILKVNIALNDLTARVALHCVGLDSQPGRAAFTTPHNNLGATHVVRDQNPSAVAGGFVLARGDDMLRDTKVDFIKIDVEGAEASVIAGGRATLRAMQPVLLMEINDMDTIEEMKTMVRDGGSIEASGRNKDDRVIASALACAAYAEQVQPQLIMRRLTRDAARAKDKQEGKDSAIVQTGQRSVSNYLQRLGINQ